MSHTIKKLSQMNGRVYVFLHISAEKRKIYWICECDCGCGTTKSIRSDALSQITVGGCNNML